MSGTITTGTRLCEKRPRAFSSCRGRRERSVLFGLQPSDMLLGVKLEPDPVDQIKLRLEEIDVVFLVPHQVLEQVAGDIILHGMTMRRRLLVQRTCAHLGGEVAIDDLLDVLTDPQGIEHLHVGKAIEKEDAIGEAVGVLHLLDRFLAPDLGHLQEAPIVEQPVVQPVLVNGSELVTQSLVKIFDDFGVALHDELQGLRPDLSLSLERF
jgi:hypothetical protein